jgi:hypothetical protein
MRFRLWGESKRLEPERHLGPPENRPVDGNDDMLQIPGIRLLVFDILGRIAQVLHRYVQVNDRYDSAKRSQGLSSQSQGAPLSPSEVLTAKKQLDERIKDMTKRASLGMKARWAVKDKSALQGLLGELTALNDGLERLLPRN